MSGVQEDDWLNAGHGQILEAYAADKATKVRV